MIFNELQKNVKKVIKKFGWNIKNDIYLHQEFNQLKFYIMKTIDTRDLIEERDNLKEQILDDFNDRFNTELDDFDEIEIYLNDEASESIKQEEREDFTSYWEDEYQQIEAINEIEDEVGGEFEYGCTLIEEDDFEDYVEDMLIDCGYISKDFPTWIEIDWKATAENVKQDYSELEYKGDTYYFRA